jgi:phage terminase large subunit-like protein
MNMRVQKRSFTDMLGTLSAEDQIELLSLLPAPVAAMAKFDATRSFALRRGQRLPDGDWQNWLLLSGRGYGKQLSVDTPIPTPSGWTANGDLVDGDVIFDQAGVPCKVVVAHAPCVPERMYRLTFSDGTWIDADGAHLWTVLTHQFRKQLYRHGGSLRDLKGDWPFAATAQGYGRWGDPKGSPVRPLTTTTDGLVELLRQDTARGDLNLSIPLAQPLVLPERVLPIDPWVMGYMLGNASGSDLTSGSNGKGSFDHAEVLLMLGIGGTPVTYERLEPEHGRGRIGLRSDFCREFRILANGYGSRNKRVPQVYLRASAAQRLELLRGLMDADGHASKAAGQTEFCSMSSLMAEDVMELARSLGQKPVLLTGRAVLNGVDHGEKYRVTWRPTVQVFNLSRKAAAVDLSAGQKQFDRNLHRMITSIEPIEPRLSRCLTVDSPSRLYLAGEGMIPTHNTRVLSAVADQWSKTLPTIGIIGATADDVRRILVEGESGILSKAPRWNCPTYHKADRKLVWPSGCTGYLFSAETPDRLRGSNLAGLLCDELAAWADPDEVWAQAQLTLRIGDWPRTVIATTPRPIPIIKKLARRSSTFLTTGSTYENNKLSKNFIEEIIAVYEGTRLGRQELEGMILSEVDAALWTNTTITYSPHVDLSLLRRVVIGLDPSGGTRGSDEIGIVAAGELADGTVIILEDATCHGSPAFWAAEVARCFDRWRADTVIAEINFGGALVEEVLRQAAPNLPVRVVSASRGKSIRAEPVALLFEKKKASLLRPMPELETQLLNMSAIHGWTGSGSPDRLDAMVWAVVGLIGIRMPGAPLASGVSASAPSKWKGRG